MSKSTDKKAIPAYVSYKSLISYLNGLREINHIPARIDRSEMKRLSGSAQRDITTALKFLKMTDDKSEPLPLFSEFVNADDEARKAILTKILKNSYPYLFDKKIFEIERATGGQFNEAFRDEGGAGGTTLPRVVAFFLSAAKEAGITVSPSLNIPKIQSNSSARPKKSKARVKLNDQTPSSESKNDLSVPVGSLSFEIPLPGKDSVKIILPKNVDGADWVLITTMLKAYVGRWKGYTEPE